MDVLLNERSISAKGESQSLCCMMGKNDDTAWLLMVGYCQAQRTKDVSVGKNTVYI